MKPGASISALLDPSRLKVAGALVGVERTTAEIVAHTGLQRQDVLLAVGSLRQAGLVEAVGAKYILPLPNLHWLASDVSDVDIPMDPYIGFGMRDDEVLVLSRYFHGRTLAEVPSNRAKRLIVLERLALEFDMGRHYLEAAVNDLLRPFHPDVAMLRRYLVDEGFLDRQGGEYWRSGGRLLG